MKRIPVILLTLILVYIFAGFGNQIATASDNTKPENNCVTFNSGYGGMVVIDSVSDSYVDYTVIPDENKYIESVKANNEIIIKNVKHEKSFTANASNSNITITVTFADLIETLPSAIEVHQEAFTPFVFEPYTSNNIKIETPYGICFATALDLYKDYDLKECGFYISSIEEDIINLNSTNYQEMTRYCAETNESDGGKFGVLFHGTGITKQTTYYTKAYAIYSDGKTDNIVFGDKVVSFKPISLRKTT